MVVVTRVHFALDQVIGGTQIREGPLRVDHGDERVHPQHV